MGMSEKRDRLLKELEATLAFQEKHKPLFHGISESDTLEFLTGHGPRKTTAQECRFPGEYFVFPGIMPDDMVTCFSRLVILGPPAIYIPKRQILGSVYDYLYKTAVEQPGYGLYSYGL